MQATTGNVIVDKSFLFAVEIVRFCETLEQMRKYVVSRQLLKSGTSIGANATVLCGIELGEYSMVGCGSVVIKSVPPKSLVVGNPAKIIKVFSCEEIKEKFDFYECE